MDSKTRVVHAEADKAHEQAETPEAAYDAYRQVLQETQARYDRALAILAADLVTSNGSDGQYYVKSQSGNGRYLVRVGRVGTPLCNCPDFRRRGWRCKHVLAAELLEERQAQDAAAQAYLDGLTAKLGRKVAGLDAGQVLAKARRYTELLPAYYDNPRIALEDGEFRALDRFFAVLNWNESTIRNLAGV